MMKKQIFIALIFLALPLLKAENMKSTTDEENCPELSGRVIHPHESGYQRARRTSNYFASKNMYPDLIVYAQNEEDVQNAVKWARCKKKSIRIRSGGHNHEALSTGKGMVIDVSEMKQLHIDKINHVIHLQPGLTGGELYKKLNDVGLTHVGGTCADVGISGLVLSGGMGPLLRKHGLACDNLISFKMVNAKGEVITATAENEHKDLFWACQGGGAGNFGVVVSMQLKVYPSEPVTWFNIGWDWSESSEKIIAAWQEFFYKADPRWFSHLDLWSKTFTTQKLNKMPIKVMGIFFGPPDQATTLLSPILNIGEPQDRMIERVDWLKAIHQFEEATSVFTSTDPEYKSTGAFVLNELSSEAISTLTQSLRDSPYPLLNVLLSSLGGALENIAPTDTAFFYRDAKFFANYSIQWLKENEDKKQIAEVDRLRNKMLPYTSGDYVGNPDIHIKDFLFAYFGGNAPKLRCVKRKYDPENIFYNEQSIPPAPQQWDCMGINQKTQKS